MPVHWYYDIYMLRDHFPNGITKYEAPRAKLPGSIMNLSNTGGGGRGSDKGSIIGDIINHGKKKYWLRGGDHHYHQGMMPGENTLDAIVSRVLLKSIVKCSGVFKRNEFVADYIKFMTTPGSHNDTYAGTCHRMFFSNLVEKNMDPSVCPDNDGHNVDAIDALMTVPIVTAAYIKSSKDERYAAVKDAIQSTRKTTMVLKYAYLYSDMIVSVVEGSSIRDATAAAARELNIDIAREVQFSSDGRDPMTACYIDSSFPAMLFFAYKYSPSGTQTMLSKSASAGGENVARTSLLGALAGAAEGYSGYPALLKEGLHGAPQLLEETLALSAAVKAKNTSKL